MSGFTKKPVCFDSSALILFLNNALPADIVDRRQSS